MAKKLLCFLLVVLMCVSLLPVSAQAAEPSEESRVLRNLSGVYNWTLEKDERESLSGLCANYVSWQMIYLGINRYLIGCNGNDLYDIYEKMDRTSGGHRIRTYSAEDYPLQEVLYRLSDNRDAYNIAMCYQQTDTENGKLYGHVNLIHAILDGMVYYSESDTFTISGRLYMAGTPIVISIAEYVDRYESWTVFEGAVEFGRYPYASECSWVDTDLYVQTTRETALWSEPCTVQTDSRSEQIGRVNGGEWFRIRRIYENSAGEYWYRLDAEEEYYLYAGDTALKRACFEGCRGQNLTYPAVLEQGEAFRTGGQILSEGCRVSALWSQILKEKDGRSVSVARTMDKLDYEADEPLEAEIRQKLDFESLEPGSYQLQLNASAYCYYSDGEKLLRRWSAVPLTNAEFVVRAEDDNRRYCVITLDGNGGQVEKDQVILEKGASGDLDVEGQRSGYRFEGWSTRTYGGKTLGARSRIQDDMQLYACWNTDLEDCDGWTLIDSSWHYFENGRVLTGWQNIDGVRYFLRPDGTAVEENLIYNGKIYGFYHNGAGITE